MDEKISFIPKRSLSSQPVLRGGGAVCAVIFLIFVISAALWGGLRMYKNYLNNNIVQLGNSIANQKASFEIPTVNEVTGFFGKDFRRQKTFSRTQGLFNVLDFLQDFTMKDVRFNDLNYSSADSGEPSLVLSERPRATPV